MAERLRLRFLAILMDRYLELALRGEEDSYQAKELAIVIEAELLGNATVH